MTKEKVTRENAWGVTFVEASSEVELVSPRGVAVAMPHSIRLLLPFSQQQRSPLRALRTNKRRRHSFAGHGEPIELARCENDNVADAMQRS
jgi:hypothetical protein